jgi:predicted HTH transcriptional regulator
MAPSKEEILAKLAGGDFEALVREPESDWRECKQSPYQLSTDKHKLELAKDVAGLANAAGGLLLIGFATARDATHGVDRVSHVSSFPLARLDEAQYASVIRDWTWPALNPVLTKYAAPDGDRGVVCIEVPMLAAADRPVLVTKTPLDEKRTEVLFGYFERKQANVRSYDVSRLQSRTRLLMLPSSPSSELKLC